MLNSNIASRLMSYLSNAVGNIEKSHIKTMIKIYDFHVSSIEAARKVRSGRDQVELPLSRHACPVADCTHCLALLPVAH